MKYGYDEIVFNIIQNLKNFRRYSELYHPEVLSKSRKRENVEARMMCMVLLRKYTPISQEKVGEILGGRDHATVVYAEKTLPLLIRQESEIREAFIGSENKINNMLFGIVNRKRPTFKVHKTIKNRKRLRI